MTQLSPSKMALVTAALVVTVVSVMMFTRGQVMSELLPRGADSTSPVATRLLTILAKYDARINETTPQLIKSNGYPVESHHVTTEDGYILELHRIPCSRKQGAAAEGAHRYILRPVAFLHHCLLCSSSDFIMNTPDKALAYLLADAGYDVWMTNARGNTYSRKHVTLSPQEKAFWQFSWTEMAKYDVPAAIDYILNVTYNKDLYYVGFSMGTTIFWAMLNEHPHYATKIRFMGALGPVAYVGNMKGPLRYSATFVNQIEGVLNLLGRYEMLSFGPVMDRILSTFCNERLFTSIICRNILFLIYGPNPEQVNKEFLPVILSHTPAGTSVRTVTHYLQQVTAGKFQKYDFGRSGNVEHYTSTTPPVYNLSLVTPPVALFWSDNDWFADPADVLHLVGELPNLVYNHRVVEPLFSHIDFVWALHADTLVYRYLIDIMSHY